MCIIKKYSHDETIFERRPFFVSVLSKHLFVHVLCAFYTSQRHRCIYLWTPIDDPNDNRTGIGNVPDETYRCRIGQRIDQRIGNRIGRRISSDGCATEVRCIAR